ncbi:MAG: class I tRNA ligase family protein, partial [Pyrinomonadaceae bacterium]
AAPKSHARRSAQTALYRIADALARLLAPILVFTADEIWENLPSSEGEGTNERPVSVHLAEFPAVAGALDKELLKSWADLFEIRELVLRKLEAARNQKIIGSSLEAHVKIAALGKTYELLEQHRQELPTVFIVSQVSLSQVHTAEDSSPSPINVSVLVERAKGKKCERCWKYSEHTVELPRYGGAVVCERCAAVLAEMEGDAA